MELEQYLGKVSIEFCKLPLYKQQEIKLRILDTTFKAILARMGNIDVDKVFLEMFTFKSYETDNYTQEYSLSQSYWQLRNSMSVKGYKIPHIDTLDFTFLDAKHRREEQHLVVRMISVPNFVYGLVLDVSHKDLGDVTREDLYKAATELAKEVRYELTTE